jgi:lysophospholipase
MNITRPIQSSNKIILSQGTEASILGNLYIDETEYKQKMNNIVNPYLDSIVQSGYIKGQVNTNIYYEKYVVPEAKGSVVISHGFTEYTGRYTEMIYYFVKKGYSVYICDHRGHGHSGSLGAKDNTEISVENFEYYIADLKNFIDQVVIPSKAKNEKMFLYAHSMGGCIGALFLEEYPNYFDAAILSSPMLEINTGDIPSFAAKPVVNLADLFGFGGDYALGQHKFTGKQNLNGSGTSSDARYEYFYNKLMDKCEYAQRSGASFHWIEEAFSATKRATSKQNASKVKVPVLLFQADNDTLVKSGGQNEFQRNAEDCKIIFMDGSKHEIYREKDDILIGYLNKVFDFYDKNLEN